MSTVRRLALAATLGILAFGSENNWNVPQKPFRIVGNVYYVGTAGIGSYLITSPQGHFLLDGGLPASALLIERNVRALGFQVKDIHYLLNTHAHYDHCGGLAQLKRDSGASMLASGADAKVLTAGYHDSYGAKWSGSFPPIHVDRIVNDGDAIRLGGVTLRAMLTPGHTKGCTTWTTQVTEGRKTHDVVFYCSTSVPGYPLVHNKEYPNIIGDYRHSFARLKAVKADVFLANHAEFFDLEGKLARAKSGSPNPFIDPGELQRFVTRSQADFEAELARQTKTTPLH